MKSFEIENIRKITGAIFAGETFDTFCVTEASFETLFTLSIDGHVNQDYLKSADGQTEKDPDDAKTQETVKNTGAGMVTWKQIRPLCYETIKGSRLPVRFKIVFMSPPEKIQGFLEKHSITNVLARDVKGLFINVYYENNKIQCTSGVSRVSFSMDRSLEEAWDESVEGFMKRFMQ